MERVQSIKILNRAGIYLQTQNFVLPGRWIRWRRMQSRIGEISKEVGGGVPGQPSIFHRRRALAFAFPGRIAFLPADYPRGSGGRVGHRAGGLERLEELVNT